MSARKIYSEQVAGVINADTQGTGITSTEGEKKTLKSLTVTVSARQDNYVELWLGREKVINLHDKVLPLATDAVDKRWSLDLEIPVGETLVPSVLCGGTASNINIAYEVEVS